MDFRAGALLLLLLPATGFARNAPAEPPLLVVLRPAGSEREGLPVLAVHPDSARLAASIDRGLAAEILRVNRFLQIGRGRAIEPAYLLLSEEEGGFARFGFWLGDRKKSETPFVDIHRDWSVSGRFGAIDQIFPHELAHAIFKQLGVEPSPAAGANQIHAVGVRTDRYVAFNEGFAEHLQVMAVDHADAAPATKALARATDLDEAATRHLKQYRRELTARIPTVSRMRIAFPLWYSNDERALRYFAVKRNAFALEPAIPPHLLGTDDPYRAYLIENVLPGEPGSDARPVSRLLSIEGAISTLFSRWASDRRLQESRREPSFYEAYGTSDQEISDLQNVYLKVFHAIATRRPSDVASFIRAYREVFPDEAPTIDALTAEVFLGQSLDIPAEIWLASDTFSTGTTLFDQFRGLRRRHTFDLNAASLVDLMTVPGMDLALARRIQNASPFASLDDLVRVPGLSGEIRGTMERMASAMDALRKAPGPQSLRFRSILIPYGWWAGGTALVAALGASLIYAAGRKQRQLPAGMLRIAASGIAAAIVGVAASWLSGNALAAVATVALLFGLPAAGFLLVRERRLRPALATLATWAATALPAVALTTPWF